MSALHARFLAGVIGSATTGAGLALSHAVTYPVAETFHGSIAFRTPVNTSLIRTANRATAVAALTLCVAGTARSQDPMAGMHMPGHIMIPKGAIYTEADVRFMQGMIAHHAQAVYMSRMAEKHRANPRVQRLADKIDQSQIAEIRIMQNWLLDRNQTAPDTSSWRTMTMPGMLTAEQLKTLDASTGTEFDRNFLVMMIQHHEGALSMVKDLFASPGAAQEVDVNVFANDVVTVQTAEIGIMQQLLAQLGT